MGYLLIQDNSVSNTHFRIFEWVHVFKGLKFLVDVFHLSSLVGAVLAGP